MLNAMRMGEVYQALATPDATGHAIRAAIANQAEHFGTLGLQLGFVYESGAIARDSGEKPAPVSSVREYVPAAIPGARMPHAWVTRAGASISTLDLFAYDRFTWVTGPAPGRRGSKSRTVPYRSIMLSSDEMSSIRTDIG